MFMYKYLNDEEGVYMDFHYKAKAPNGNVLNGTKAADNEADVVSWIRNQGWVPIEISKVMIQTGVSSLRKSDKFELSEFFDLSPRVKLKDKLVFFRQLSTMISAGVTISRSMEILVEQTVNKRFKKIIKKVYDKVSSGVSLSDSLAGFPKNFDTLMLSLINSGEESGTLEMSLSRLSTFIEDQENLRKKIISAMTYPLAVIMIAFLVLGVMLVVVVPQFQQAFKNLNVELPKLTQIIFDVGTWAKENWILVPSGFLGIFMLIYFLKKIDSLKYPIDSAMLKIPLFGGILYKAAISRSFRTMGSLLSSGLPVLKALDLAGEVSNNEKLKRNFHMMRDAAIMGMPINLVMKEKKLFPPMISHMVAVGEETGRTDAMLEKIADWYEAELTETIKRLSSILEPVLIVFVGGIVGIMVLAIFLPIIAAIQAFM